MSMEKSNFLKGVGAVISMVVGVGIFGFGFMADFMYGIAFLSANAADRAGFIYIFVLYTGMAVAGLILLLKGIQLWKQFRASKNR